MGIDANYALVTWSGATMMLERTESKAKTPKMNCSWKNSPESCQVLFVISGNDPETLNTCSDTSTSSFSETSVRLPTTCTGSDVVALCGSTTVV